MLMEVSHELFEKKPRFQQEKSLVGLGTSIGPYSDYCFFVFVFVLGAYSDYCFLCLIIAFCVCCFLCLFLSVVFLCLLYWVPIRCLFRRETL